MSADDLDKPAPPRGRVWDLPVRITHWLLVGSIALAWLTREARYMDLHAACGYCALILVAFRVAWGFIGTRYARFSEFGYSPRDAARYLREALAGAARHYTGHNPAGSWAVYSLLAFIALACLSGVAAIGAMFGMGPLPIAAGPAAAEALRSAHEILAWALLAIIAAHVAGALWGSRLHRENLVASLVTGRKRLHGGARPVSPKGLVAAALAAGLVAFVAAYLQRSGWTDGYRESQASAAAAKVESAWSRECGGCHLAYPPSLLPASSWSRMLREQSAHFGEDLSLEAGMADRLAAAAASPQEPSWAAWMLAASAAPGESPQRITGLPGWRDAHRHLAPAQFAAPVSNGAHDCEACHADAYSGIFAPRMIRLPGTKF